MEQQYKRIYYLDLMKSIAIISVVFYHGVLPQITMTGTMKFYSYYFLQAFAAVATPLFFFVNGFLFIKLIEKENLLSKGCSGADFLQAIHNLAERYGITDKMTKNFLVYNFQKEKTQNGKKR